MAKTKAKIIATIGPASSRKNVLRNLADSGVSIMRFNLKYADNEFFDKITDKISNFKRIKIMIDVKDRDRLKYFEKRKVDYVAVSFAEKPSEIEQIRKMFPKRVKIIAKIETLRGAEKIDALIRVSDGIMIARGDLGRNIGVEKVPLLQKLIARKCNGKNKFSIVATEVALSMVNHSRLTRAEVSDIANAILEGNEMVMLSEETSIGKHPVLVVKEVAKIIHEIEKHKDKIKT